MTHNTDTTYFVIPAGAIEERKPRPLTDAERAKLRDEAGGFASKDDLDGLAKQFAKPSRHHTDATYKGDANGWGKDHSGSTVDWGKQERLQSNLGRSNDQFVGQARGKAVAKSGVPKNKRNGKK